MFKGLLNTSQLTLSRIYVQILTGIAFIFIARLLGPTEYGEYTIALTFVGIFQIFTVSGLNKVVIREGCRELRNVGGLFHRTVGLKAMFIAIGFCLCIIGVWLMPYSMTIKVYTCWVALGIVLIGMYRYLGTVFIIFEKFKYPAAINAVSKTIFVVLAIPFLFMDFGVLFVVLALLISNMFNLLSNIFYTSKFIKVKFTFRPFIEKPIIMQTLTFTLISVMTTLATKIDLFMISVLSTSYDVGIYGLAYKLVDQGVVLGGLISIAFFPIFVKKYVKGNINPSKLFKKTGILMCGMFLFCILISYPLPRIIAFLFGGKYLPSIVVLKILLFYLVFAWGVLPFTLAAQATYNEKIVLVAYSIMSLLNIVLNLVLFKLFGLLGIAYSTLIIYAVGASMIIVMTSRKLRATSINQ